MPYTTTLHCGDILTARLTFGDRAEWCTPGLDAVPGFANVRAYETYYRLDDDNSCDEACLGPLYRQMKASGSMRPLVSGDRVTVLSVSPDPDDKRYRICRVRTTHGTWLVICNALTVEPD